MIFSEKEWYADRSNPYAVHLIALSNVLVDRQTAFQRVEIVESQAFGRMLILDDELQSAALDEHIYHETLVQPAMVMHPQPCRVLIAGGGEGATAREVLRHACVGRVLMADIDGEVVDLCRTHLPQWHANCYEDPRLELRIVDALRLLEASRERYDVIILDLPDPVADGPARHLATPGFYQQVREHLLPGGIIAMQAGDFSPANRRVHLAARALLEQVFPHVVTYSVFIPSFHTEWSFLLASADRPVQDNATVRQQITETILARKLRLRFYNAAVHAGMFHLLPGG
ncbi:MAG TPA: fused MFS/spermidine synthase [Kiritimatiellia bacterium]|nr:fused MFS/spermidine synthase [Kiritimatiellia bacterium]HRU70901.1 fused MFS/spermidine synthase [Kiritimatiellia bacterium]